MNEWLRQCIHCGLCLNACPTYRLTGDEVESPRGRLFLIRELLGEGREQPDEDRKQQQLRANRGSIDRCLGCLACQTVCPSGVPYADLLGAARVELGPTPDLRSRATRWLVDEILSRPRWLALLAVVGQILRRGPMERVLPRAIREPLESLPRRPLRQSRPWPQRVSSISGAAQASSKRVAVLRGCAQWVFEPEVLSATCDLIRAAGAEAVVPENQGCCGALSHHQGSPDRARDLARVNLRAFAGADRVVAPSAGCSAFLCELEKLWPQDSPHHAPAAELARRSEDILSWLAREATGLRFRPSGLRVVYQNPCHHQHAQSMHDETRYLLGRVPGLRLIETSGDDLCCGSAGSYQLLQPDLARRQRDEKLEHLLRDAPELILTANPGCEFFLEAGLDGAPRVTHIVSFLADQLEL
jgi:glycolate dehydrogenase iron-sulfur subunit